MIKGVNRQIIEVTDTGNTYFERAWLVVRPSCCDDDGDMLREEANRLLKAAGGYSGLRIYRRRRQIKRLLLCAVSGLCGVLLGCGWALWF